jgi:hypothetical protein
MIFNLIESLKNKQYLKKEKTREYISLNLLREIKRIQTKMESEYKRKKGKKFKFNKLRASDYIAHIIQTHRQK